MDAGLDFLPRESFLVTLAHPIGFTDGLTSIAVAQHGAVSRAQALASGLTDRRISGNLRSRRWQRPHPGVYVTFTGPLPYLTRVWAALRYAGDSATVSHETAGHLQGLLDDPPSCVHLTIGEHRRVRPQRGLVLHRARGVETKRHPARDPPQTRIEDTVLDLLDHQTCVDDVVALITRACQRRLTTAPRLAEAIARRSRCRWRALCIDVLGDVVAGVQSALERRYVSSVERAHGLPRGRRNVSEGPTNRRRYRDVRYDPFRTVVELDGSAAHPPENRAVDQARDNDVVEQEGAPLRYGWASVAGRPCESAGQVARVLQQRGWTGRPRPCGPGCTLRGTHR